MFVPIRVVIVDDTESLRDLLRAHIDGVDDMEVVGEATDGLQAIAVARKVQPEAIILDVEMPVLDGLEALEDLRAAAPGAKIVLFSSRAEVTTEERALARGGDAFFRKGETKTGDVIAHVRGMFQGATEA